MNKKTEAPKTTKNKNTKLSSSFFNFSLLLSGLIFLIEWLSPKGGLRPYGIRPFHFCFIILFILLTISIIFAIKALRIKENPKNKPLITLILSSLLLIISLTVTILSTRPCPKIYDTEKKNDIDSISTAIISYRSENKGNLPNNIENLKPYLTNEEWNNYNYTIIPDFSYKNTDTIPRPYSGEINKIQIYLGAECNDEDQTIVRSKRLRSFAILTKLEESEKYYCIDD